MARNCLCKVERLEGLSSQFRAELRYNGDKRARDRGLIAERVSMPGDPVFA